MEMELEGRPTQPLMLLKEWLELESSAELSRDGFGCYPRHLAAELRSVSSGRGRLRGHGDMFARLSAAVRAALLFRPPPPSSGPEREAAALSRSLSRRLQRAGFWKKRGRDTDETGTRPPVPSCSSATVASGRSWRGGSSSPATSPRRLSREVRRAGGDGAGLGGRRSHETEAARCECETTCHLDEEREQQRLSPVSVMDFLSQDEDDDCGGGGSLHREEDGVDEITSPSFDRSVANVRRASELLLQKIRQFEQLAELDPSDVDAATTATEDTSFHVADSDVGDEEAIQELLGVLQASSPVAARRFQNLLLDFFRDGLSSACPNDTARSLVEAAESWLDGRQCTPRTDWKAEVEEIERHVRWRCFREDEQELIAFDVEGGIFRSLMEELVDDLC